MSRVKKIVKTFLGIPLTLIAFAFIIKIFFEAWPNISPLIANINPTLLIVGVFFMITFFLLRSLVWLKLLETFSPSEKVSAESIYHYSLSETKRYIPGSIFSFISRVHHFESDSYSKKTLVKALTLEVGIVIVSAALLSLPAILNKLPISLTPINLALLILPVLIALTAFLFLLQKKLKLRIITILLVFLKSSLFKYIDLLLISLAAWMTFGIASYFFATTIFNIDPQHFLLASSIFIAAWLAGYLSFITPMGLGVREAATIFFLTPIVPLYAATAIAVFTRLMMIVSELLFLFLAWMVYKFRNNIKNSFFSLPLILVSLFAFLYTTYFTFFTIMRHMNFFSGKYDLGNMDQTVWNTLHGRFFTFLNPDGLVETSRLATHADFILVLFAPLYFFYESPIVLLIIQTVVIALGGFFVFLIAQKVLNSSRLSVLLAAGYYLNYFIQEQNVFDFHAVSLATIFLLGAFYFYLIKQYKLLAIMLILAVLTKENVFLIVSLFGILLWKKGVKTQGVILFFTSLAIFVFLMAVAIPNVSNINSHFAVSYLSYLGDSPIEIILSPLLKPTVFFSRLLSPETLEYLKFVLLPTGFLSLFAPLYLIFIAPDVLINVLSDNPNLRSIQYHYGALIVPFVYISTIYGIERIIKRSKRKDFVEHIVFYYLLLFILISSYLYGLLPGARNADLAAFKDIQNKEMIYRALEIIPENASVAATNAIAAHLSERRYIYVLPLGYERADFVVFYKEHQKLAEELRSNSRHYAEVEKIGNDFLILKRITPNDSAHKP